MDPGPGVGLDGERLVAYRIAQQIPPTPVLMIIVTGMMRGCQGTNKS